MGERPPKAENYRWVLILLICIAGAEFTVRGPARFLSANSFSDFVSPYIQSRAWMGNMDPYSPATLVQLWPRDADQFNFLRDDLAHGDLVLKRGIPTAYPPTTLILLAPLAALPWHLAHALWTVIGLASFAAAVLSLAALLRLRWHDPQTLLFLAFALALAPFHTGLAAGSIVIVAVGISAAAVLAANRGWDSTAGILTCVATGLKPQIGLPILAFYLLRKRWKIAATASGLLVTLAFIGISVLVVHGTPWLENYKYDNRMLFAKGSLGDYTEANPIRFSLINLQVLLYIFWPDRTGANLVSLALVLALGLVWLLLFWRCKEEPDSEFLALSALLVLTLLPIYHRFYDATLLIFPLAWSLRSVASGITAQAESPRKRNHRASGITAQAESPRKRCSDRSRPSGLLGSWRINAGSIPAKSPVCAT
jgi:Glycosyltransferase family 87